jgi:hypothetical protein
MADPDDGDLAALLTLAAGVWNIRTNGVQRDLESG